ncbi:MAG: 6-bladed beta-propeller [Candidatus Aminicenantes bacterium]|nr:6-bladed beta-propeller [Candidatus Aminicenantes bacterium]NIM78280.1 6-bladed beta-propeller [Candidatus Aminicenantes bacterium]NIN19706.1 6-bladed beta-propeller [Candidatus Aminicenantes bacterium]NIN43588.1 6-bladed beta-propeller [Candidatus Aminicenantes bacterium]NIN86333.1 6-bladed beta-propeller [Candidatus Aminicenantes bacterium]
MMNTNITKIKAVPLITAFLSLSICLNTLKSAVLVHNTLQEIEACKGKLHLKLIRIWGGDEEEDENKFFKTPKSIAVDADKSVYICDWHNNCIRVFDYSGKYFRTIGRKGRGPGDVFGPYSIAFSPNGNLVVNESAGRRIQWFNPEGKSKKIVKIKGFTKWIGITSKNELAVYNHQKTFYSRKLVSIYDNNGKVIRKIGKYHDKSKSFLTSEKLHFSIDANDNVYAANMHTPVIRKYSHDGRLIIAITFDPPFGESVEIFLNSKGDGIVRKEEKQDMNVDVREKKSGVTIHYNKRKGKIRWRVGVTGGIAIDSKKRIYIVTLRRRPTEKEMMATAISGTINGINRSRVNYNIVENIDYYRLLVFNSVGKIVAEAQMSTLCEGIYIHDNRIFVIDGLRNQRILEYEISFDDHTDRIKNDI